jgi:hypothetical protein
MNKIDKEDILLFRDTVNTQAPVDKDGVLSYIHVNPILIHYQYDHASFCSSFSRICHSLYNALLLPQQSAKNPSGEFFTTASASIGVSFLPT